MPITVAMIPAINPYILASTINGPRIKLRSAPINFIIEISSLRVKIAIRMVLKTINDEITINTTVAASPTRSAIATQFLILSIAWLRSPLNDASRALYWRYWLLCSVNSSSDEVSFTSFSWIRMVAGSLFVAWDKASSVAWSFCCFICSLRASLAST